MQAECTWIIDQCPSLRRYFADWCDVQELVAQCYKELTLESWSTPSPGPQNTLKAMRISGWRSKHQVHSATGDAVKCLAVLSGLLHDVTLQDRPAKDQDTVSVYTFVLSSTNPIISKRDHFFTTRISATSGEKLPLQTPYGLAELFAEHRGLCGVGLNARIQTHARGPVRYWRVLFRDRKALDDCVREVDGSTIEGVEVGVTIDARTKNESAKPQSTNCMETHKIHMDHAIEHG
jgi:hypothetical protein